MNNASLREKIHTGIDRHCASMTSDPYRVQRILYAAHQKGMEQKPMKKKLSLAVIMFVCLLLVSGVAIAAMFMNQHIEQAMEIAVERNAFTEWTLEDKLALIDAMQAEGIALPESQLQKVMDDALPAAEREQAATTLLVSVYGDAEYISHFTMASHDWGDPFLWTLEQKVWFWETLREKGLYTGRMHYLMPGENDLSRDEVVQIARREIQQAYGLTDEQVFGYDADVTFFALDDAASEPRWLVHLGYANAAAAEYSILLTRDGQVTEDKSLYVFLPGADVAQETSIPSTVEKPYERYLHAAGTAYLSDDGHYHLLNACPAVSSETLHASENVSDALNGYEPCPYCVMSAQLWSAADKISYGVMIGSLPAPDVLPEAEAEQIAREHLLSGGKNDVEKLVPYLRYISFEEPLRYEVYYARLEDGLITPVYMVVIDAANGTVLNMYSMSGSGLG